MSSYTVTVAEIVSFVSRLRDERRACAIIRRLYTTRTRAFSRGKHVYELCAMHAPGREDIVSVGKTRRVFFSGRPSAAFRPTVFVHVSFLVPSAPACVRHDENTYVDGRVAGQREHSGRRRFLRHEPVELLVAKVPFDRVQRHSVEIVVARQPQRLARADGFGIPNAHAFQAEHVCGPTENKSFKIVATVERIRRSRVLNNSSYK